MARDAGKPRRRSQLFRQKCAKAGIRSLCPSVVTSLPSTTDEAMPAVWRNSRDMTSKLTWILNLWKMSSHNKRNTTWELVVEQVSKFLKHTLPMLVAKSRMEARKVCEDLELISVIIATMASEGMGGGWVAGGSGTDVVEASIV